jgi:ubiquinone/menaquinone biosynthesis C-methylase UbiE
LNTTDILEQLDWLLASHEDQTVSGLYDAVSPHYESFRSLWLDLAGSRTEAAMLEDLGSVLQPDHRVLDAGCGTGAMSRRILEFQPSVDLTLVDASEQMLEQAGEIGTRRLVGDITALPFDDDAFDVVTCAWVIETVPDPKAAIAELLRVLAPEGFLLYTFCSLPSGWLSRQGTAILREFVTRGFAGQFLEPEETPWHDCDRSRRVSFHGGLSTYILLRKCCTVSPDALPAVSAAEVPPTLL